MVKFDLATLVKEFSENVAAQTDAIWSGDARTGNKHAKRYIRAFERLRAIGDEGREALVPLMSKEHRPDVRATAAAFLLRYRHDEARKVLQEIARGAGLIPFEAQEALKRWDEGVWQLDPV
ncbi:MAG: DUF2019 domain-containing protein [Myxococcales bacterium]|nr:DUF2019 domain-containing protein [Myxococcales bacterium]